MPYDGSGNFNRVMNWVNDALANIKIKADRHDSEDDNFAAGLSNVITKDGQSQPTANIPFNGKRLVNVANPVNPQDAMTLAQMAASNIRYDVAQALTIAQQLQAHANLASTANVLFKSAAYNLLQADRNKLLFVTAACTVTLPTPATVGNDFVIDIKTMGGALTLTTPSGNIVQQPAPGVSAASVVVPDNYTGRMWCDGANWQLQKDTIGGQMFKRTVITVTPGSGGLFTYDLQTKNALVEVEGGGGPGGAASSGGTQNQASAGSGGGAGGYVSKFFSTAGILTATLAIAAGASAPSNGNTSSYTDGTNTLTAGGGLVGPQGSQTNSPVMITGGAGGTATGGDINTPGERGGANFTFGQTAALASIGKGGQGADSKFGEGGAGFTFTGAGGGGGAGGAALGFGAGGGGGCAVNTATTQGGGTSVGGLIIITEYR